MPAHDAPPQPASTAPAGAVQDATGPQRPGADGSPPHLGLRTGAVGFGAGLLNGLLGIGGGILLVPGLIFLRNATAREAVSTSLGTVLFLATAALAVHLWISGLSFPLLGAALLLAAGGLGTRLGSALLNRTPQRWILYLFAAFTFVASTNLILEGLGVYGAPGGTAAPAPLWSFPLVGGLAGLFSGLLGIGGGGVVVLLYAVAFRLPILHSLPLALASNVVNALTGVLAQRGTGHVLWREVARLVPMALVGVAVGVGLAVYLPPNVLKVVFALFFIYMGVRLFARGRRS
jgi:uncharacterized protein